ncbi:MAG: endonuclease/exonuclease/phosphatase family protein [Oricola sp.]
MSFINRVKYIRPDEHKRFVANRLRELKKQLQADIKDKTDRDALRLATWNVMHFSDGGGYTRTFESLAYIAEIIDHFDLVAIQEVNHKLDQFQVLMNRHLGPDWDYILTDASGNRERLAFVFRKAKVRFLREAGEIVLPEGQEIVAPGEDQQATRKIQFARTPFAVTFQSGWFKFKLCTVHIFYGDSSDTGPEMALRRAEIEKIAQFLADIQTKEKRANGVDANMVLLGDFNIISPEHKTMQALLDAGFKVPDGMATAGTNLQGNHHYDQIVFRLAEKRVKFGSSGVFDIFKSVYRSEDADHYFDVVKPPKMMTKSDGTARTREQATEYFRRYYRVNQLSDHKLLWCELLTDFSDAYLADIASGP